MNCAEAMAAMLAGKQCARPGWTEGLFITPNGDMRCVRIGDVIGGESTDYDEIEPCDVRAKDWFICPPKRISDLSFTRALKYLHAGYRITWESSVEAHLERGGLAFRDIGTGAVRDPLHHQTSRYVRRAPWAKGVRLVLLRSGVYCAKSAYMNEPIPLSAHDRAATDWELAPDLPEICPYCRGEGVTP